MKQAAGRESYAQFNNSGTFIRACLIVSKVRRRRRRRVLDITRVSFFPVVFVPDDFALIIIW